MKILLIEWGDAFIDIADFTVKEARKTKPVFRSTVGFLVVKNKYGYVLATDTFHQKGLEFHAKMFIPHGMVISVEELTE